MSLQFTILGCGNSTGVPAIGNYWGVCDPKEPRNRRFRCSLAVQKGDTTLIIDTSPDISHQTALFDISNIDGVFYTHQHSDHVDGIHELRSMYYRNAQKAIPCYGSDQALAEIAYRYDFMFKNNKHAHIYPPVLAAHSFKKSDYGQLQYFNDISYIPFEMDHGTCTSIGYRFGELSYCVDMKFMDDKALESVKGSKIWVVDGSGYNSEDHPVHADFKTLYEYNDIIGAQEVYVTGLSPMMDYQTLRKELPEGFFPAYDGLSFTM